MWPAAVAAAPVAAVLGRADSYAVETMKMFGIPESTLAKTLREIERDVDLDPLEITTCLRRGVGARDRRPLPGDRRTGSRESLFVALRERHGRFIYTERGRASTSSSPGCSPGRSIALAESCTGGLLAARLTDLPGASAYFSRWRRRLLRSLPRPSMLGVAGGADRRATEPSRRRSRRRWPGARSNASAPTLGVGITGIAGPGGGTRGEAGRLRLHLRRRRRRQRAGPRPEAARQPRRRPRPLGERRPAHDQAAADRRGPTGLRPPRRGRRRAPASAPATPPAPPRAASGRRPGTATSSKLRRVAPRRRPARRGG